MKLFLSLNFFLLVLCTHAQNLLPDGSFENYTKCPTDITAYELRCLKFWYQPSYGTPDYFNPCDVNGPVGVPKNSLGFQYAHSGKGYAGILLYSKKGDREYLTTGLNKILRKGRTYYVQLYVSLADNASYAVSDIQVLFTAQGFKEGTMEHLSNKPQLSYSNNKPVTDTANWTKIEWEYTAEGGEAFLTVGNFNRNGSSHVAELNYGSFAEAYYYIDAICVSTVKDDSTCICNEPTKKPVNSAEKEDTIIVVKKLVVEPDKAIILQNVFFESNKSDLLPASFKELGELVDYLRQNSNTKIIINGFTDNTGDEKKNLKLSEDRAKAVADYLVSKGILKARVSSAGYGSANPIADNLSEEGKAKNRRVEIKIVE